MRIVQSIPDFDLGGIQKAGCILASHMAESGHDVTIVGAGGGPRLSASGRPNPAHVVVGSEDPGLLAAAIRDIDPDVIHIHAAAYAEPLLGELLRVGPPGLRSGRTLLVSTPVFGRPPSDWKVLARTKTCCVGVYTFYRLCRWLGVTPQRAMHALGIAYAPLTPFDPPLGHVSATDADAKVRLRRQHLGLPAETSIVVGRIGRAAVGKWHPATERLVDAMLRTDAAASWLSVGLPRERGAERLRERWGPRFVNFPETADYNRLTEILSAMDLQIFFSAHGECFASSICEAAGSGVPTVALATPLNDNGQAEQVIDGTTGFLVNSIEAACRVVATFPRDRAVLARLKRSTQAHAHDHWHARKVSDGLLSMYRHWQDASSTSSPQIERMLRESTAFGGRYRKQMISLMAGSNPWRRLAWRLRLAAAESWTLFRLARSVRRGVRALTTKTG